MPNNVSNKTIKGLIRNQDTMRGKRSAKNPSVVGILRLPMASSVVIFRTIYDRKVSRSRRKEQAYGRLIPMERSWNIDQIHRSESEPERKD